MASPFVPGMRLISSSVIVSRVTSRGGRAPFTVTSSPASGNRRKTICVAFPGSTLSSALSGS